MRVLLVTNDYPPKPGGIQQYLGNLVDRYDAPLRVLGPADGTAADEERVVRHRRTFMLPTPGVRRWITQHVVEFRPDVIVFGAPHPLAQLGPRLYEQTGVPFVVIAHGAEVVVPLAIPGVKRLLEKPLRKAGTVFAVSEFTRTRLADAIGRPIRYLGMGVDTEVFTPADELPDEFVLGCVSRFVPRKGHQRVIEAVAELRAKGHAVSGLLVGKGRLESRLRATASRLGVPIRFEVGVPWDRLPELYRAMSMFAMPARSRWFGLEFEGLGIVYLEAAASGLPVLAGTSGGAPETVREEVTGFVGESVGEIVEAAEAMMSDRDRATAMGSSGRAFVSDHYSWQSVMDRFEAGLAAATSARSL